MWNFTLGRKAFSGECTKLGNSTSIKVTQFQEDKHHKLSLMCISLFLIFKHVHFRLHGSKLGKWKGICETEYSESLMKWGRKATKYMRFVSDNKRGEGEAEG